MRACPSGEEIITTGRLAYKAVIGDKQANKENE
jgi:hypothetical protein